MQRKMPFVTVDQTRLFQKKGLDKACLSVAKDLVVWCQRIHLPKLMRLLHIILFQISVIDCFTAQAGASGGGVCVS